MRYLVTGSAGFIGFHVAKKLLAEGHEVVGVDGFTPYYDVSLKRARHRILSENPRFAAHELTLENGQALNHLFEQCSPDVVIHLAAQAGVRYSLENPRAYIDANLIGTFNVLESCRAFRPSHLLMASTSSVYGANIEMPFREVDRTVHQMTLYAATKQSTELMAHCYSHLWDVPTTIIRFFTVYGPWGRPDMALFLFTRAILDGRPIEIFNNGQSWRDFTYIDDLVKSINLLTTCAPSRPSARRDESAISNDTLSPVAAFRVVNIGGGQPVKLSRFVDLIEETLGIPAQRDFRPLPKGDVERTYAAADLLEALVGYKPSTPIEVGVPAFIDWYRSYYRGST